MSNAVLVGSLNILLRLHRYSRCRIHRRISMIVHCIPVSRRLSSVIRLPTSVSLLFLKSDLPISVQALEGESFVSWSFQELWLVILSFAEKWDASAFLLQVERCWFWLFEFLYVGHIRTESPSQTEVWTFGPYPIGAPRASNWLWSFWRSGSDREPVYFKFSPFTLLLSRKFVTKSSMQHALKVLQCNQYSWHLRLSQNKLYSIPETNCKAAVPHNFSGIFKLVQ